MNLFALDESPELSAQYACDKHVVKMATETAQILGYVAHRDPNLDWSSFPRRNEDGTPHPYRGTGTHRKHPCTLWAGETSGNWAWTVAHGLALCEEYRNRYGRTHAAEAIIRWFGERPSISEGPLQPFVQCMPEECKDPTDPVRGYRNFYRGIKAPIATWRAPSTPPPWWKQMSQENSQFFALAWRNLLWVIAEGEELPEVEVTTSAKLRFDPYFVLKGWMNEGDLEFRVTVTPCNFSGAPTWTCTGPKCSDPLSQAPPALCVHARLVAREWKRSFEGDPKNHSLVRLMEEENDATQAQ